MYLMQCLFPFFINSNDRLLVVCPKVRLKEFDRQDNTDGHEVGHPSPKRIDVSFEPNSPPSIITMPSNETL